MAGLKSSNTTRPAYLAIAWAAAMDVIPSSSSHSPGKAMMGKPNGRNVFFSARRRISVWTAREDAISRAPGSRTMSGTPASCIFGVNSANALSELALIAIGALCALASLANASQLSGVAPYSNGVAAPLSLVSFSSSPTASNPWAITSGSSAMRINGRGATSSTVLIASAKVAPSPVASMTKPSMVKSMPT